MSELKPCPFCGSEPHASYVAVSCRNEECIANAANDEPTIGLIESWNTRPIEDALTARIAELEAAQRWIPVSERLPEVGEEVFVCDESGHRRVDWLVCKPIDGVGETLFYSAGYDDDPPTHWMPLPKLPEVQE